MLEKVINNVMQLIEDRNDTIEEHIPTNLNLNNPNIFYAKQNCIIIALRSVAKKVVIEQLKITKKKKRR